MHVSYIPIQSNIDYAQIARFIRKMALIPGIHLSPEIVTRLGIIAAIIRYYRNSVDIAYKYFWECTLRLSLEGWGETRVAFRLEKFREEDMIIYVNSGEKWNLSFDGRVMAVQIFCLLANAINFMHRQDRSALWFEGISP